MAHGIVIRPHIRRASSSLDHGRLAGRVRTSDVVSEVGGTLVKGVPICQMPAFSGLRDIACSYADMPSDRGDDKSPCSALSFGLGFRTVPAARGDLAPPSPDAGPSAAEVCADSGVSSCF